MPHTMKHTMPQQAAILIPPERAHLTGAPGAYGLLIELSRPMRLEIATLGPHTLAAGRYIYVGSANGLGGIRARAGRHLRGMKRPHWHVDHLIRAGRIEGVLAVPGGSECALAAAALGIGGVNAPLAGFGSSDCGRCPAHLFAVPGDGVAVLRALAD